MTAPRLRHKLARERSHERLMEGGTTMLRIGLVRLLVLAMVVTGTGLAVQPAVAAGPDFTLSAAPPSVDLSAGQSASTNITVTTSGGFTGGVALSLGALPAGVTGTLTPSPSSGVTLLQLTASSSVASTTTTITVTGTGGGITHTLRIPLSL